MSIQRLSIILILFLISALAAADDKPNSQPTNRLAKESSPYLLQHAHNPVDWFPWGEEAFAKAKKEGKLVFLSVGYSSCHWCHVMERESFSNKEIAEILNKNFVCIKVDREERPDIDHIYMTALQVGMGQNGGWPMSMFLTDAGKPIVGGTYWPPDDREIDGQKMRGFKSLLLAILEHKKEHGEDLLKQADEVAQATRRELSGGAQAFILVELNRELVNAAIEQLKASFDPSYGGFGSPARAFKGPKFPRPPSLLLLQHEAARSKSKELDGLIQTVLEQMARGGICDQLGGGFHRYTVERTWTVPHFEKMLYDNAQLLELYAQAYSQTKNPLYHHVLTQTIGFLDRELSAPEGGFYSALDADSEGEEGKCYVWKASELAAALPDKSDLELVKKIYGADGPPNFEKDYFILVRRKPIAEVAKELRISEKDVETRLNDMRPSFSLCARNGPSHFLIRKFSPPGTVR